MTNKLIISHSQMSVFETCPRKWYYQYIEKQKPFTGPWLHFGKRVHSMIETELNTIDHSTYSIKDFDYEKKDQQKAFDSAKRLVKAAIDGLNNWDILKFPGIEKLSPSNIEKKFELKKFRGYIDLMYTSTDNTNVIIDWKTTSKQFTEHDIKTAPQLTAYAWAFNKMYNKIPDVLAFITLDKKTHKASLYAGERSKSDIAEYQERVNENYDKMKRKISYRNENGCKGPYGKCPFYNQCWNDKKPVILEEDIVMPLKKKEKNVDWF